MAVAHLLVLLPIVVVASFGLWPGWGVLGVWRIVVIICNRMILVDFGCCVGRCMILCPYRVLYSREEVDIYCRYNTAELTAIVRVWT